MRRETPWITLMVEARIEDVLKTLRQMPAEHVDETLLGDLHRETVRLLRRQAPGRYDDHTQQATVTQTGGVTVIAHKEKD